MGRGLPRVQARAVALSRRGQNSASRLLQVCFLQCGTEALLGEGPGLLADEVHCGGGASAPPPRSRGGPPRGAEDVAHALHEVRSEVERVP